MTPKPYLKRDSDGRFGDDETINDNQESNVSNYNCLC